MSKSTISIVSVSIIMTVLLLACGNTSQRGNMEKGPIRTQYYDLDKEYEEKLQEIINSSDLQLPTERGLIIMQTYLFDRVIRGENPINNNLRTNYFWHIYNALPSFVEDSERHKGYYVGKTKASLREQLLAYGIYRIDRSPHNINRAFAFFEKRIPRIISSEMYISKGLEQEVNSLINSYNVIASVNNYQHLLQQAYNHVDTATATIFIDRETGDIHYEDILPAYGLDVYSMNRIISYYLGMNPDIPFYSEGALSFWMRRNHEGNMDVVYDILNKVDAMY